MEPFTCERIEEAGGIADQQPARARATGNAMAERRGTHDGIGPLGHAPGRGVVCVGGVAATMPVRDDRRTAPRQLCPPAPSEDDADVDAPTGDRCDADIAVVEYAHPGIMLARWVRIAEVICQADARPRRDRRLTRVAVATTERKPSAPTTTSALSPPGDPSGRRTSSKPMAGSNPVAVQPRRTSAPARSAIVSSAGSSVERSKPDGRLAARLRAIRQPKGRPAGCLDAHGRDRASDAAQRRLIEAHPAQGDDGGGRREDAGGPPPPFRSAFEDDDLVTQVRQPGGQDRAGRSTAHDRDLDLLRGHSPTPRSSRSSSSSSRDRGTAAIA